MERPDLTASDLEEVDRLLALSAACGSIVIGRVIGPIDLSMTQGSALRRAAEILGVCAEQEHSGKDGADTGASSSAGGKPPVSKKPRRKKRWMPPQETPKK